MTGRRCGLGASRSTATFLTALVGVGTAAGHATVERRVARWVARDSAMSEAAGLARHARGAYALGHASAIGICHAGGELSAAFLRLASRARIRHVHVAGATSAPSGATRSAPGRCRRAARRCRGSPGRSRGAARRCRGSPGRSRGAARANAALSAGGAAAAGRRGSPRSARGRPCRVAGTAATSEARDTHRDQHERTVGCHSFRPPIRCNKHARASWPADRAAISRSPRVSVERPRPRLTSFAWSLRSPVQAFTAQPRGPAWTRSLLALAHSRGCALPRWSGVTRQRHEA